MARVVIGVSGAAGRMGSKILALAAQDPSLSVGCALEASGSAALGRDAGELAGTGSMGLRVTEAFPAGFRGVLIDFSTAAAVPGRLAQCLKRRVPLVVGTTGLSAATRKALRRASARIPVLVAPNMSLGANLLARLAETSAAALAPQGPDVEIVEIHHAGKADAPSGTALWLADAVGRGASKPLRRIYGRKGMTGIRPAGEIAIHSVRAGGVSGDHTVLFGLASERIELVHRLESRDALARGAIAAAKFLARAGAKGFFTMGDVLGEALPGARTRPRPG